MRSLSDYDYRCWRNLANAFCFLEQRLYLLFDGLRLYAYSVGVLPILFHDFQVAVCADCHPTCN